MTNLVRFSPGHEMRRLQTELDTVFNDFFSHGRSARGEESTSWTPRVDVRETEHAYVVQVDVPGVNREDLNIDYHEGTLSIRGERRRREKQEDETVVRTERSYGTFYRGFSLPKSIEVDAITAQCEEGVLTIEVPKAEESRPRRISVG